MDKNSAIGFALIAAILIGYNLWTAPTEAEILAQQTTQDSISAASATNDTIYNEVISQDSEPTIAAEKNTILVDDSVAIAARAIVNEQQFGVFGGAVEDETKQTTIENEKLKVTFSNKGAAIVAAELKEFTTHDSLALKLFVEDMSNMSLMFKYLGKGTINTSLLYYKKSKNSTSETVAYRLRGSREGQYIDIEYHLLPNTYRIESKITFAGLDGIVDMQQKPAINWNIVGHNNEKNLVMERQKSSVFFKYNDDDRDYLSETADDEQVLENNTNWVAFKQNFFSVVAISNTGFVANQSTIGVKVFAEEDPLNKTYAANLALPFQTANESQIVTYFLGPNEYNTLRAFDNGMDRIIDFGWGIFGWVNKYLVIPIFNFLDGFGIGYGWIILILTIIIKGILFFFTYKNYKSSAKMKALKPEIDELNEKMKNADATKKQQATLELYRKTGVNPMAGCLPMILQMPILYAMFRFFPSSIELRQEPFLWADDLSSYDSIASLPFEIPFYGDHVSLFTILMCISTLIYTRMNSSNMPQQQQPGMPNMKVMMYIFPFMMLFFFNSFSCGLSYYYFLANVITMLQMFIIKKYFIDENKLRAQIQANKANPAKAKKSKFQQRLDDMAKQRAQSK
jgi:YidC/Oxa1 family membrane protein insertase